MALIQISLPLPLNVSLQAGDIAYYVEVNDNLVGGFQVNQGTNTPIEIGPIVAVVATQFTVENESTNEEPSAGDFILFSKNRNVNEASIVGYFAEIEFKNNSKDLYSLSISICLSEVL